jgi:hypothetical protein
LTLILNVPGIGAILQDLAWSEAPTAAAELAQLAGISGALAQCNKLSLSDTIAAHGEQQYQVGLAQLKNAARAAASRRVAFTAATTEIIRRINALPSSYSAYKSRRRVRSFARLRGRLDPAGAIDFILRNFQYRYVNVFDYLKEYSAGRERRVDLITAHLVDYDWPIAGGVPTYTSIPDQVEVMSAISVLTGGRVHCFAPFDPLKQVAYDLGRVPYSPLTTVMDAITNHGFVGVKLYPPMGFQPYGNNLKPTSFWNRDWLPDVIKLPDLGARLDSSLAALYTWCLSNDVPIMAHTAPSNGPNADFKTLSDPGWWKLTLRNFPGLRINFGHFGNTDQIELRAIALAQLMTNGGTGANAYADTAYFTEILDQPSALAAQLTSVYRATAGKGDAALAQRLMYGTDWEMIIAEGGATETYLTGFENVFRQLDTDSSLGARSRRWVGRN